MWILVNFIRIRQKAVVEEMEGVADGIGVLGDGLIWRKWAIGN